MPQVPSLEMGEWLLKQAITNGECLECHYKSESNGYANIPHTGKAHRFIWVCFKGPIPEGLNVLHSCDNRRCINLSHLWLGTHQDNMDDMLAKGRRSYVTRLRRISAEQKKELLALQLLGWSYEKLGTRYGVTKQTIYKYVKGYR